MPVVRAGPNQYLLVGRKGVLENRGSAVQAILRPGTVYVLIPSTKQEAAFEFTQETKDGIPLRFKGSVLYRITDPAAAARLFDFTDGEGPRQITSHLTHVTLAELRHAVSHMTMTECIEQRKTTLSGVVAEAMQATIHDAADGSKSWGIEVEIAQVAQVFIVDPQLRQQLEAEVRNEIKLKSDRSNLQSAEAIQLAELARERRMQVENLETERQVIGLAQQRLHSELEAEQDRVTSETPVRMLRHRTRARDPPRGDRAAAAPERTQGPRRGRRPAPGPGPAGDAAPDPADRTGATDRRVGVEGASRLEPVDLRRGRPAARSARADLRAADARGRTVDVESGPPGVEPR